MPQAHGPGTQLIYIEEVTRGTTPGTPAMTHMRLTSRNINLQKALVQSSEMRTDRMAAAARQGFNQVVGSPGFDLSTGTLDDMLESLMSSTWVAGASVADTGAETITAAVTANTYTRGSGNYVTDGFEVGQRVIVSGYSSEPSNNGEKRIIALTTTVMTVAEDLATEAGSGDEQIIVVGNELKIGTTQKTFSMERGFTDIDEFQMFRGVTVNQLALSIQPESIVNGSMELLGMGADAATSSTGADSEVAAGTAEPMNAFSGYVYEGAGLLAVMTGLELTCENNRSVAAVAFSEESPDMFEGHLNVSGTLSLFLEDSSVMDKFKAETATSIDLKIDDPDGTEWFRLFMPNVVLTGHEMDPPQEGPVVQSVAFTANPDTDYASNIIWQRSTA